MLERVPLLEKQLSDYAGVVDIEVVDRILRLAEPLRGLKVLGLLSAFAGLALAFADGLRLPTRRELGGDLLELAGAVLWGATTLVIKARRPPVDPHRLLFYQLAGSAPLLLAAAALAGPLVTGTPGPRVWLAVGYQTVVVVLVSYLAWFWLLGRHPASTLSA